MHEFLWELFVHAHMLPYVEIHAYVLYIYEGDGTGLGGSSGRYIRPESAQDF